VIVILIRAKLDPSCAPPVEEQPTWRERLLVLRETGPVLLLVIGVFGGLFTGVFTPTEAGAAGAALALVIGLVNRSLTWAGLRDALTETLLTSSALFIIAIGANLLTRFLAFSGAGDALADLVIGLEADKVVLLIGISLVYLLLGMFLEPIGAMLLTLPILLPIIEGADLSLLWFGVVLAKFLEIGMITPPIGLNVFVIKSIVGDRIRLEAIFAGIAIFLLVEIFVLAAIALVPALSLWLPGLMM
jgi:tripartite ATP-independent transporter DctM subunit